MAALTIQRTDNFLHTFLQDRTPSSSPEGAPQRPVIPGNKRVARPGRWGAPWVQTGLSSHMRARSAPHQGCSSCGATT
ncbi:hypothetical protein WMY93_011346 [Mugilogobius chulae]|uniref:Uncharacterized protein n=1 Tax=Mugilogobius chulae TaxID=88201 RepID=A0AAW0P3Q7_9GOBI